MNQENSFQFQSLPSTRKTLHRNPFLEKEEEYKRINEQLERKSSELFDRIDNFSKSHRLRLGNDNSRIFRRTKSLHGGELDRGGHGDSLSEEEVEAEVFRNRSTFGGNDEYEYDSVFSETGYADIEGSGEGRFGRKLSISSDFSDRCVTVPAIPTSKRRQPSRLQQATESVIKNLQGKLTNQEERMAELTIQYRQKIQENTILESKVKLLEDEREKLFKTIGTLQGTVEKHAKNASSSKSDLNVKESALGSLKKEICELKREQRNYSSSAQTLQTRLHRALEENGSLKNQNRSLSQQLRDLGSESRQQLDGLSQRIHELERQKGLLHSNLFKQTQIVDQLKQRVRGQGQGGSRSTSRQSRDVDDRMSCFSS